MKLFPGDSIYYLCDTAYNAAADLVPEKIREAYFEDRAIPTAFILGFGAGYLGERYVVDRFMKRVAPNHDPWKKSGATATASIIVPFLYSLMEPEAAKKQIEEHPVFTFGLIGVALGLTWGSVQDAHSADSITLENLIQKVESLKE